MTNNQFDKDNSTREVHTKVQRTTKIEENPEEVRSANTGLIILVVIILLAIAAFIYYNSYNQVPVATPTSTTVINTPATTTVPVSPNEENSMVSPATTSIETRTSVQNP